MANINRGIEKCPCGVHLTLIDIVITAHQRDKKIVKACVEALKQFCQNFGTIYIISQKKLVTSQDVVWINETTFPFKIADLEGDGWLFQQLLKLYSPLTIDSIVEYILIIDADCILRQPMIFAHPVQGLSCEIVPLCERLLRTDVPDEKELEELGTTIKQSDSHTSYPHSGVKEIIIHRFASTDCVPLVRSRVDLHRYDPFLLDFIPNRPLIKKKPRRETAVVHHSLFQKSVVCQMIKDIELAYIEVGISQPFWKLFLESSRKHQKRVSEYELYFNYLRQCVKSQYSHNKRKLVSMALRSNWEDALKDDSLNGVSYIVSHHHLRAKTDACDLAMCECLIGPREDPHQCILGSSNKPDYANNALDESIYNCTINTNQADEVHGRNLEAYLKTFCNDDDVNVVNLLKNEFMNVGSKLENL